MVVHLIIARRWTHSAVLAVRRTPEAAAEVQRQVYEHLGQAPPESGYRRADGTFHINVVPYDTDDTNLHLHWLEEL